MIGMMLQNEFDSDKLDNASKLNSLIIELAHYRQQSEWLSRANDLYVRLAGATDLSSMIEAFSIWLMPLVPHDLIAYSNPQRKLLHKFCSCHGPARRSVMESADLIFQSLSLGAGVADAGCVQDNENYARVRRFDSSRGCGHLLLLRKEVIISDREMESVDKGLEILSEPLGRALDYEILFEQARRDSLTGLANRRVFEERLEDMLDNARRYAHPITIASMDLDNFKKVNDSFGHAVGDKTLIEVARALETVVRNTDLLVRLGGDEFVMILPDTGISSARILADRIWSTVNNLNICTPDGGKLGISIGLTQWDSSMSKDEWLQVADETLYRAKATGRSRVCITGETSN